MVIGGVLLGASAIAGLLMTYQVRQTNDVINSTKAFFAADAGVEHETYDIANAAPAPTFSNGAAVTSSQALVGQDIIVRAEGTAGGAVRALESQITAATSSPTPTPQITAFSVSGNANLVTSPCSGSCPYHSGNPDPKAPVPSPALMTLTWASQDATSCTGGSSPAAVWSTTALSGSQGIDIGGQVPPITLTLTCSNGGISASTSTTVYFIP